MENNKPKVSPGLIARDPKPLQRVGYGVYRDAQGNLTTSRGRMLRAASERRQQSQQGPRAMPMPAMDPSNLAKSLEGYQRPQQPPSQPPMGQPTPPPMPMPQFRPQDYGQNQQPQQPQGKPQLDPELLQRLMEFLSSQQK